MSLFKTTMSWLGLGPDADYEPLPDQGGAVDPALTGGQVTPLPSDHEVGATTTERPASDFTAVRSLGPMSTPTNLPEAGGEASTVRDLTGAQMSNRTLQPVEADYSTMGQSMGSVRAVPARGPSKPQIVAPRSFNDAQEVADRFRGGAPVLLNLRETDAELGRRLIDFCSGLCYGLGGQMQRVGDRVFLVTPADVQLSAEDHRMLRETGLLT